MESNKKIPIWYWIIVVVLLLWNLAGVFNFFGQITATEESLMEVREEQRMMILSTPPWVFVAFGIAVFSGVFGAIFLFLRMKVAKTLFILSILAAAAQSIYSWSIALGDFETFGVMVLTFTIMIFGIGILAIWFSVFAARRNWLR